MLCPLISEPFDLGTWLLILVMYMCVMSAAVYISELISASWATQAEVKIRENRGKIEVTLHNDCAISYTAYAKNVKSSTMAWFVISLDG
jgi:hypothetical protein